MMAPTNTLGRSLGVAALWLAALVGARAADPDPALVERGAYLAVAGDCTACHTAPGGKPMAGGLPLATPLGAIVATNITPSKTNGIGNYTLAQFSDALRRGVRGDGAHLYPAMPYTSYAKVTDEDTRAMYAYFMLDVPPVDAAPTQTTNLPFPFNIRASMAGWNMIYLDTKPYTPDPNKSAEWNRGAYLARGLAHCGSCHTPRNMLMAETASRELHGAQLGPWFAPNITSDPNSGVGGWSDAELIDYMKLGRVREKAHAAGPMAEAIDHSLRFLNEADLRAISVYLKQLPPKRDPGDSRPVYAWGQPGDELASVRGVAWPADRNQLTGPQLYDAHCASCHHARAQGSTGGGLPSLYHATTLGRANSDNLVMVMLDGIAREQEGTHVLMPGFRKTMSDQQLATLGSYLTRKYGNPEAKVTTAQVATLRSGGPSSSLVTLVRVAMVIGVLVVLALIYFFLVRRRRHA